jgi:hypothetical protein
MGMRRHPAPPWHRHVFEEPRTASPTAPATFARSGVDEDYQWCVCIKQQSRLTGKNRMHCFPAVTTVQNEMSNFNLPPPNKNNNHNRRTLLQPTASRILTCSRGAARRVVKIVLTNGEATAKKTRVRAAGGRKRYSARENIWPAL